MSEFFRGDARRPRVGRALVGNGWRGRRPGRGDHRRAPGIGQHARERHDRRAVALSCFGARGARRTIVCPEMDFPSLIYLYRAQAQLGFTLRIVPREPDLSIRMERLVDAIDETTVVVGLSHVLFRTSFIVDPAPIVERAHRVGAAVILDTYQSAGIIPVDATALGVDFAVGGCLKWLCGGPGNAFLYTRPDLLASLRPRLTGWVAHRRPFDFDPGELDAPPTARKMMNGTPAIPAYYTAIPRLDIVRDVGVSAIREKSRRMTARLLALVDRCGFTSIASRDPERLAGTVAANVPDALPVSRALKGRDYVIDYGPGVGIRVSPHFSNTFEELDRLMAELSRIVRTKDYDGSAAPTSVVT